MNNFKWFYQFLLIGLMVFSACTTETKTEEACASYFNCNSSVDTEAVHTLTDFKELVACGDWASTLSGIQKLLDNDSQKQGLRERHELKLMAAEILWKQGNDDEAEAILKELWESNKSDVESPIIGRILYNLGEIYYIRHYIKGEPSIERSKTYHFQSLKTRTGQKDSVGMAHSMARIGVIHEREENVDSALYYFEKAIEISESIDYELGKARPYIHLGVHHRSKGDLQKAYDFYREGYEINMAHYNLEEIPFNIANIVQMESNDAIPEELGQEEMECALRVAKKIDFKLGIVNTLFIMGIMAERAGETGEAKQYFSETIRVSEPLNYKTYLRLAERRLDSLTF